MTKKHVLFIYVLLYLLGSGCNRPRKVGVAPNISSPSNPIQTWIDAPLPNANLPLLPYKIIFHGASPVSVTEFEVQINGVVITTVPAVPSSSGGSGSGTLFLGEYVWTPLAPGTYLIEVRSQINGKFGAPDQVRVTISAEEVEEIEQLDLPHTPSPLPSSSPSPSPTPSLTPSPSHTATEEEVEACTLTALVNLFCRPGPGYEPVDSFTPGQTSPVIAQSQYFWKVISVNKGIECTVPKDETLVSTTGDCDNLPFFTQLPTPTSSPTSSPTASPTVTLTETPQEGCTVFQPDGTVECIVPCPVGADPGETCTP